MVGNGTTPTIAYGMNFGANWKGIDFSFMLYTKQGQWSRSYFHEQYMNYGDRAQLYFK